MEYRCRVDYRWGRTMSTFITLIVIGKPAPYVHWYRDNELIDDTYTYGTGNNTAHNELYINKLTRTVFNSVLSCRAVKPIDVEIVNARHTLTAGREVEMTCESRGSRPPAQITCELLQMI
ncbi:unnamed protein product, partial [Oppiella nova]